MTTTLDEQSNNKPKKDGLDLGRAITFVADEPGWIGKLLIVLGLSALATLFITGPLVTGALPLFPQEVIDELSLIYPQLQGVNFTYTPQYLALIPFAVLGLGVLALILGYYIEIVRRVRYDKGDKLPNWSEAGAYLKDGAQMTVAYVMYLASNFLFITLLIAGLALATPVMDPLLALLAFFCLFLPLALFYGILIIFLTSICVIPFSETGRFIDFFNFSWVWRQVNTQGRLTINWFTLGVAANMGFSAAQSLPVVGVLGLLLSLAMQAPVQGHLLGQYAALLDKRKKQADNPLSYGGL